jgi:hypothetical protein
MRLKMISKFLILISMAAGALMASMVSTIIGGNFMKQNDRWEIVGWTAGLHGFLVLSAYAVRERHRRGVDDQHLWLVTVAICYSIGAFGFLFI